MRGAHPKMAVRRRRPKRRLHINPKAVLIAVGAVATVMILAAVVPLAIPTSAYRGWVEGLVARSLDARVSIGKFRFQLLPYPGYTITNLGLISKSPPFQGMPILTAEKVRGSLSFWDLIGGRIETSISARGVTLDARTAEGLSNLEALLYSARAPAEVAPEDEGSEAVVVRSVAISDGRFQQWKDGAAAFAIGGIALSASHLPSTGGVGADFRMSGRAGSHGSSGAIDVDLGGQLFADSVRHEISARGLKGIVAGSPFIADLSINRAVTPASFELHLATPGIGPKGLAPLLELVGLDFPTGVSWQGVVAADVSLKGTREAFDLTVQAEGAAAKLGFADLFAKGAGLPFRALFAFFVSPQSLLLKEGSVVLGQETLGIRGELTRAPEGVLRLSCSGSGLNGSALKPFFPKLSLVDALEGLDFSFNVEGMLQATVPMAVKGSVQAKRLVFAGMELVDVQGTAERTEAGDGIVIPTLKATAIGGKLSGNGWMTFGETAAMAFDGVIEHVDPAAIAALGGMLEGEGSMVVRITGTGPDASSLPGGMKFAGSLLVPEGSFKELRLGPGLFTDDLWKELEAATAVRLDAAAEGKLATSDGAVKGLSASFEMAEGKIAVDELAWSQPPWGLKVKADIDAGAIRGEGELFVEKGVALQLVAQPAARRTLLSGDGRLILPIVFSGKIPALEASVDHAKLAAAIGARTAALAPQPKTAKEEMKAPAVPAPAPRAPAAAAPKGAKGASSQKAEGKAEAPLQAPQRASKGAAGGGTSAPPTDEQVDDILRVIIGK